VVLFVELDLRELLQARSYRMRGVCVCECGVCVGVVCLCVHVSVRVSTCVCVPFAARSASMRFSVARASTPVLSSCAVSSVISFLACMKRGCEVVRHAERGSVKEKGVSGCGKIGGNERGQ
jgi:hypothetical protein